MDQGKSEPIAPFASLDPERHDQNAAARQKRPAEKSTIGLSSNPITNPARTIQAPKRRRDSRAPRKGKT